MRRKMPILAAIVVVLLAASADVSLAQYKGPPIIIQTPQPQPPINADALKPTMPALPAPPPAAAPPAAAAPAAAVPARPCAANTNC